MSRFFISRPLIKAAALLCLLAIPAAATADVLQIEGSGYSWTAGGPAAPNTTVYETLNSPPPREPTEPAEPAEPPLAFTAVFATAGPAQWQARIGELSAKYDISPALLEALVWQESRWNSGAVSPKGARGFTQLMPGTARELGVNASDPSSNLEGGARFLRSQLDAFNGDLEKALAAYNAGPRRVQLAGGIPNIRETQNYVRAILARLADPVRR